MNFIQVESIFQMHQSVVVDSMTMAPMIAEAAKLMAACLSQGGKIMTCGNGGSAADAQHFACELVGRFLQESRPMAALALTTDPSTMTALGNDYGFERSFSRQVEALGRAGDVLIAISTSGNSANVVSAARAAKEKSIHVVGLTGSQGGELFRLADLCLSVPSDSTPRIQEMHELIIHVLCQLIEEELA